MQQRWKIRHLKHPDLVANPGAKLTVHIHPPFGREGGEGVAANRAVVQAAFSTEVMDEGANSSAIELDPETVVVLRVKEHRKPDNCLWKLSLRAFVHNW